MNYVQSIFVGDRQPCTIPTNDLPHQVVFLGAELKKMAKYAPPPVLHSWCWSLILRVVRGFRGPIFRRSVLQELGELCLLIIFLRKKSHRMLPNLALISQVSAVLRGQLNWTGPPIKTCGGVTFLHSLIPPSWKCKFEILWLRSLWSTPFSQENLFCWRGFLQEFTLS